MIFQHPQLIKTTEVLTDLARINNDRIEGYQAAVNQTANLITELRDAFYIVISEGLKNRQELLLKIKQLDGDTKLNINIWGEIYKAWRDLKVAFTFGSEKSMVTSCLYNEEIALHAYRAALGDENIYRSDEIFQMINQHEQCLVKNHSLLKSYRGVHQNFYQRATYLAL
jgi:uncharacterized protein (TIGR02284 family)